MLTRLCYFGNLEAYAGAESRSALDMQSLTVLVFKTLIDVVDTDALVFFGHYKQSLHCGFVHAYTVVAYEELDGVRVLDDTEGYNAGLIGLTYTVLDSVLDKRLYGNRRHHDVGNP